MTVLVVVLFATALAELVRLLMGSPRPEGGFSAQAQQVALSAWRAAEVLTGLTGFALTLCGVVCGIIDDQGARMLWELFGHMTEGTDDSNAWMKGFSCVLTAVGSALTIWATHTLIRERLRGYMMRAAERVLDIKEW